MSMISEFVKELRKASDWHYHNTDQDLGMLLDKSADTIEMLSKKARGQGWISCSERLPEDNKEVLMSLRWGIDIGEYRNGEWHSEWINHYDDDNVLAWMPLPPAYKGANDETD